MLVVDLSSGNLSETAYLSLFLNTEILIFERLIFLKLID